MTHGHLRIALHLKCGICGSSLQQTRQDGLEQTGHEPMLKSVLTVQPCKVCWKTPIPELEKRIQQLKERIRQLEERNNELNSYNGR